MATPIAAEALAVRVSVLESVAVAGLKVAVTPLGRPEAVKVTLLLNPFCGVIVIVLVPLAPWVRVMLAGDADREKPGIGPPPGQLFTRFAAFTVPMPVAKSQPVVAP